MSVVAPKSQLRHQIRQRRRDEVSTVDPLLAAAIADLGFNLAAQRRPKIVASYISYGQEVPTTALNSVLATHWRLAVPAPAATKQHWVFPDLRWETTADSLCQHYARYGPTGEAANPADIDLVFVPALAVSVDGMRLGQGGGWYDRALPELGAAQIVAVTWSEDVLETIPHAEHDVAVDMILTPNGYVPIRR